MSLIITAWMHIVVNSFFPKYMQYKSLCIIFNINVKYKYRTANKIMSVHTLKFVFESRASAEGFTESLEFFSFGFISYGFWPGYAVTHHFWLRSYHIAKILGW